MPSRAMEAETCGSSLLATDEEYLFRHQVEAITELIYLNIPDSKVHEANMGPIWGRQDPGGPHVGPMNFAIWDTLRNFRRLCVLFLFESYCTGPGS